MKGKQKKMLLLKNTGSDIFDEAYFILKDKLEEYQLSETEMIREANRIVNENLISGYFPARRKKEAKGASLIFFLGTLCGAALCVVCRAVFSV